jgi:DNA-directed RNA polymerase subunit RPC12/RpoP
MIQRDLYPPTWEQLAYAAKERAGWMCEVCMVPHGAIVRSPRTGNPYVVYLQAAHIHHDQENPYADLKVVCPRCHKRYFSKPKGKRVAPCSCERLNALHRRSDRQEAQKRLAQSRQASGASSETILSKNQLSSSPSYSSRVQFSWQLEEGRYE